MLSLTQSMSNMLRCVYWVLLIVLRAFIVGNDGKGEGTELNS